MWREVAQAGRKAMRKSFYNYKKQTCCDAAPRNMFLFVSLPGVARRKAAQAWRKAMRKFGFELDGVM